MTQAMTEEAALSVLRKAFDTEPAPTIQKQRLSDKDTVAVFHSLCNGDTVTKAGHDVSEQFREANGRFGSGGAGLRELGHKALALGARTAVKVKGVALNAAGHVLRSVRPVQGGGLQLHHELSTKSGTTVSAKVQILPRHVAGLHPALGAGMAAAHAALTNLGSHQVPAYQAGSFDVHPARSYEAGKPSGLATVA